MSRERSAKLQALDSGDENLAWRKARSAKGAVTRTERTRLIKAIADKFYGSPLADKTTEELQEILNHLKSQP